MLAGIIVDNFSALRERQQVISEDKYNICFICGMHKNKINKLYGSKEGGYNQHIKLDHYYWNYLFFIMTLLKMKQKDMNEIENETLLQKGWVAFTKDLNVNNSFSKARAAAEAADQAAPRDDGLVGGGGAEGRRQTPSCGQGRLDPVRRCR